MSGQKKIFQSIKWTIVSNWGQNSINALITFILAALLGPKEFGIVAIASVYIVFIQMFVESGFNDALIQHKDLKQLHLDSIFWLILASSLLLSGISIALSRLWANMNNMPELALVICALSINIPIRGLIIVQQALLHRAMDFKSIAIRDNVAVFISGCLGVSMAFGGFGIWALVAQQICKSIVSLILLWKMSHWRPQRQFSLQSVKDLLHFSVKVFFANLGGFLQGHSDALFLGVFFGPMAVGLYRFADRIMSMLLEVVTKAIHMVSLPFFSSLQDNKSELKKSLLMCWKTSATATIPSMMALAAISDRLVDAVGPKWRASADVLKILCLIGIARSIMLFTGTFLKAVSRPGLVTLFIWSLAIATTLMFVVSGVLLKSFPIEQQIFWVAVSRASIVVMIFLPINLFLIMRFADVTMRDLITSVRTPIFVGLTIILTVIGIKSLIDSMGLKPITAFGLTGIIAATVGFITLVSVDNKLRRSLLSVLLRNES
ncbi:MAG: lipopolysaccharide biosynthesis protein [Candidatus Omnitrophica bacterium]|nr:lipopolysaccharide biosynthesis protein [Candidatus Omnitrophota bacterium]